MTTRPNQYGTLSDSVPPDSVVSNGDTEEQPLLGRKPNAKSWLRDTFAVDLRRERADVVLLACYVITGMLDSASIATWGAFVSMMEPALIYLGNTVYIGLGPTAGNNRWKKSGISVLAFCLGSFVFSRFHRVFSPSPKRRWVLCASFIIQALFIIGAAAILTWGPDDAGPDDVPWYVLVPIALVAFQACGQAVASRALKYNALTSVVLTSIYCDLFSDAGLFQGFTVNAERNRRLAAPILLLIGALIGGIVAKSSLGTAGALWIAAALKLVMVFTWAAWPRED